MSELEEVQRISARCRAIVRDPCYSEQRSAQLIEWLQHENPALADLAGRALIRLGAPAYEDLLAYVEDSRHRIGPEAIWVLTDAVSRPDERLLTLVRRLLAEGDSELHPQCAIAFGELLCRRKEAGAPVESETVSECFSLMRRYSASHQSMAVYLRSFNVRMGISNGVADEGSE